VFGLRTQLVERSPEIDANQRQRALLTVFPGPIESVLVNPLDSLRRGTRFYGRIWISKRGLVIRYYRAQMLNGEAFPICAVARRDGDDMRTKLGAYPGSAELEGSAAWIDIVDDSAEAVFYPLLPAGSPIAVLPAPGRLQA